MALTNPAEIDSGAGSASGPEGDHLYSAGTIAKRLDRVRARLDESRLDAILVSHPENRLYLSGFTGHDAPPLDTAGLLLISREDAILITDGRYDLQAAGQLFPDLGFTLALRGGKLAPAVAEQVTSRNIKRLGFETAHLLHMWWRQIDKSLPDTELVPTFRLVEPLRNVKDDDELRVMRRAISISDQAFNIVSRRLEAGMTEKQVAWEIEKAMRDFGADDRAFSTIVASGPNGAMAHAIPGSRQIQEGEPVVIDMGARLDGYNSDMTRTVCIGKPTDKFREIYNIVLEAHLEAERKGRAGMSGVEADAIARGVIDSTGYGDKFTHSLGHGIGLEVHEALSLSRYSEDTIPDSSIASIEPGIYIEGWGGVRIEDLALFRTDGAEVLTQAEKQGKL